MEREIRHMRNRMMRRANSMREEAISIAKKRKEEYLGARVPKELRNWVIQKADDMGIPVSTYIRKLLEDAYHGRKSVKLSTVEKNSTSGDISTGDMFPSVIGWEEIRLNKTVHCASCQKLLEAGIYVTLGLARPGEEHTILCSKCKDMI